MKESIPALEWIYRFKTYMIWAFFRNLLQKSSIDRKYIECEFHDFKNYGWSEKGVKIIIKNFGVKFELFECCVFRIRIFMNSVEIFRFSLTIVRFYWFRNFRYLCNFFRLKSISIESSTSYKDLYCLKIAKPTDFHWKNPAESGILDVPAGDPARYIRA